MKTNMIAANINRSIEVFDMTDETDITSACLCEDPQDRLATTTILGRHKRSGRHTTRGDGEYKKIRRIQFMWGNIFDPIVIRNPIMDPAAVCNQCGILMGLKIFELQARFKCHCVGLVGWGGGGFGSSMGPTWATGQGPKWGHAGLRG